MGAFVVISIIHKSQSENRTDSQKKLNNGCLVPFSLSIALSTDIFQSIFHTVKTQC